MIASRRRAELNDILACFPDGATNRITYPAAYCPLTVAFSGAAPLAAAGCKASLGRSINFCRIGWSWGFGYRFTQLPKD